MSREKQNMFVITEKEIADFKCLRKADIGKSYISKTLFVLMMEKRKAVQKYNHARMESQVVEFEKLLPLDDIEEFVNFSTGSKYFCRINFRDIEELKEFLTYCKEKCTL